MNILNFSELAKNSLRRTVLLLADAGYEAINIDRAIKKRIKNEKGILKVFSKTGAVDYEVNLSDFQKIFLVGIGKGSYDAVSTLKNNLGGFIKKVAVLDSRHIPFEKLRNILNPNFFVCEGTHPYPSLKNVSATKKMMAMVEELTEKDLLITFVCGGGSALACGSEEELKCSSYVNKELTKMGADIIELNTVRKHISKFKGGGLAKLAYPATVLSLIASDVCGNDLSMVASGPTVKDHTTKEDAEKILEKYEISKEGCSFEETPKEDRFFEKVKNVMFACNEDVIFAMQEKAKELKIKSRVFALDLKGEAKDAFLPMLKMVDENEAIFAAGETTITFNVKNPGAGGRSMESVLGLINYFDNNGGFPDNLVAVSLASDGRDNTDAAGAIADLSTVLKARAIGINIPESLHTHGTYDFFRRTNDLIFSTKKSFNVADFMIILKKEQ